MRTRPSTLCLLACVAWLLLACRREPPKAAAPSHKPAPAAPAPEPVEAPSVLHTVSEGETLWDIARAYGVEVNTIMKANGFGTGKIRKLSKGAKLKIPGASQLADVKTKSDRQAERAALPELTDGAYHFLRQGESLWELARSYDIPIEQIMERNGFGEDVHGQLRIGQPIVIPGIKASQVKPASESPRGGGFVHEVARGETVWDIAHSFQVGVGEIMAANAMTAEEAQNIRDGAKLFLPGVEDVGGGRVRRKTSARERRAMAVAQRLGLGSLRAAGLLLHGRIEPRWVKAAGGTGRLPAVLRWPVSQGWFVRGYGSGQGGYHKAMDIMGRMGWNVRAAADGIVGYAGDEVSGFGNMVMVVHPGGWVTLYAHNSVNFVAAGERVRRGAVLAEVGSTGRSMGPHVHFELIYDGKNCDPAPLLRPGVQHRSGRVSRIKYTAWRNPKQRPSAVACAKRQKHPISVLNENPELDAQPEGETQDAPAITDDGGGDGLR